ncbi:MAG: hypothetical protein ACRDD2_01840 [Sarcina sp.]
MKKVSPIMKRHRIFGVVLGAVLLITLGFILYSINVNFLSEFSNRELAGLRSDLAVAGAYCFAGAGILFCARFFLKYSTPRGFKNLTTKINLKISENVSKEFLEGDLFRALRTLVTIIGKIAQNLHVIFALAGTIVISLHVYIAFHIGFKFTIGYILGLIALILLILLVLTSLRRVFNKSIKSHKYLGVLFIVFMGLHLLIVKP